MKALKCVWFTLLVAGLPYLLPAQDPAWERINPLPSESSVKDMVLLPNNRIVAVGTGATIMITDDFGETWDIQCQPAHVDYETYFTSVCFIDEYTGFVTGSHLTLLKTVDGGESWIQISGGENDHYLSYSKIHFVDDSTGFLSGYYWGVFLLKTFDGGTSWDTMLNPDQLYFNGFQFVNQNTGFLISAGVDYYHKSDDGGLSWDTTFVEPAIENLEIKTINFVNEDIACLGACIHNGGDCNYIILKSNNGGNNWYEVFSDPSFILQTIYFMNDNIGLSLGALPWYTNSLLRTDNGGESWQITDTLGNWFLEDISIDENGTGLMTGRYGQIYKTTDWGINWNKKSSNLIMNKNVLDAKIIADSTIIAVTSGGTGGVPEGTVIRSGDAGTSWIIPEISGLFIPRSISFVNDTLGFLCGSPSGLEYFKTIDGGYTWQAFSIENNNMGPSSICFIDDQTGFIGGFNNETWNEIYKTVDGGENWDFIESETMGFISDIYDIEFKDDLTGYIAGDMSAGGSIVKTEDCGETWFIENIPFESFETLGIYWHNSETGFIYGLNQIIKTIDGGQSWDTTTINLPGNRYYTFVHFPTPETGYATGDNIVFKSTDGGNTWEPLEPIGGSQLNTVNFFTEDLGIAMGNNGVIYRTTSGGTVGIPGFSEDLDHENNWTCYPNPFSEGISFVTRQQETVNVRFRVYGLSGNLVYENKTINHTTSFSWNGRTSNQKSVTAGIYLCEICQGPSKEIHKIVKM